MNTSKIALYTPSDEYPTFSGSEAIINMFEHTDENGVLFIPEWTYDSNYDEETIYKCKMNWSRADAEKTVADFNTLYDAIKAISEKLEDLQSDTAVNDHSSELQSVWNTYIRDFETGSIDLDQIADISDKFETIALIDSISCKINKGEELSAEDSSYYNEYKDTSVSESEKALYNKYRDAIHKDAERRLGDSLAAYDVIIRAKRLCKLLSLKAPAIIVNNEASLLAQAMVIHNYCVSMETVDDVE